MIIIKTEEEIKKMKIAGDILKNTFKKVEENLRPGISTKQLDTIIENYIRSMKAVSAEKGYPSPEPGVQPFPGSACISVNDEIIHGIPTDEMILKDGDIVSIDLVVEKDGYNADAARTYIIGKPKREIDEKLVKVTKQAFFEGLKYAKPDNRIGDISNAIYEYVVKNGFDVIREFQGHGIGRDMHEEPGIPNFGKKGVGPKLRPGMTIAIEPMVVAGDPEIFESYDGWTILTADGENAAHYENTVLITKNEPKLLT